MSIRIMPFLTVITITLHHSFPSGDIRIHTYSTEETTDLPRLDASGGVKMGLGAISGVNATVKKNAMPTQRLV